MMKTMILWSGGLDSTWLIAQQTEPVDILSIRLKNHADKDRSELEETARNNLKQFFPQHNYMNASLEIETGYGIRDTINSLFIAGQYAKWLNYTQNDQILQGCNSSEDATSHALSNIGERIKQFEFAVKASYGNELIPKLTWPDPAPSRLQELIDLAEIANLTWSCRKPNNSNICGQCVPCIHINSAKKLLERKL